MEEDVKCLKGDRLQTRAVLVTYNNKALRIKAENLADLAPEELVDRLRKLKQVGNLAAALEKQVAKVVETLSADKFSFSLEVCLKTYLEEYERTKEVVLHIHLVLERVNGDRFNFQSLKRSLRLGSMDVRRRHLEGGERTERREVAICK